MNRKSLVIYGGAFNPPGNHHCLIAKTLADNFDQLIIVPCGSRKDKNSTAVISLEHRQKLTQLGFADLPNTELDFDDLENGIYTPTYLLQEKYQKKYPDMEIWQAVGEDLILGGKNNNSPIQKSWIKGEWVWQNLNFVVIAYSSFINPAELPPHSRLIKIKNLVGRSTLIRARLAARQSIDDLVSQKVADYILINNLYQ